LPKPDTQLTSKKQVKETLDILINASPLASKERADDDAKQCRFFGYDKESQYQKGPSGFQIIQTHDQRGYYATLNSKNSLFCAAK
jgi:hypothetical protein